MTQCIETPDAWSRLRHSDKWQGQTVGFVPTMGHLHAGHAALIQRSQVENDRTVVSVFVNDKQFNQVKDFETYPRTEEADVALLSKMGVDAVFAPTTDTMYPDGYTVRVHEISDSQPMEGQHRPGHFEGVLTVVLKLFNIIQPERAYFGEKDYQQYQLVTKMAQALFLSTQVVACPTVRDANGVALSSRNSRLSHAARRQLRWLPSCLSEKCDDEAVKQALTQHGFEVEYVHTHAGRRYAAVRLEGVRLIDNVPCMQEVA